MKDIVRVCVAVVRIAVLMFNCRGSTMHEQCEVAYAAANSLGDDAEFRISNADVRSFD